MAILLPSGRTGGGFFIYELFDFFQFVGVVGFVVGNESSFVADAFGRYVHLLAGGVVVELHGGASCDVGLQVGCPIEGAAEVLHRWKDGVVVHLEGGWDAIAVEPCGTTTFFAFGGIGGEWEYPNGVFATGRIVADVDGFYIINENGVSQRTMVCNDDANVLVVVLDICQWRVV